MRKAPLVISLLVCVASCGFYTDLLISIFKSGRPSVSTFVRGIPKDLLDTLENNEQQAGQFVCAVLDGDVPGAFENLATELATDVWEEIQTGFEDVTSFIESLPTLAPAILDNIISDGEDAISVIEELFTNPGGALTVIEGDVMTVISDVDSCNDIMAVATTTYSPTDQVEASITTYPSAQPTQGSGSRANQENTSVNVYRAPSFFWASINEGVRHNVKQPKMPQDTRVEIVYVALEKVGGLFGPVRGGFMQVRGKLKELKLVESVDPILFSQTPEA
ncbi:hypothetical protein G7Y89_g13635 [Cudoniella acicularis]|uniref:Uncharacterized protein n=1 Tax=Cudoniella acicularis TaxID=354080 RepID=A0A8H4VVV1_9HELO|nr:hypothetical protein G7Y89_g13635 [Cudoniella acicularis]